MDAIHEARFWTKVRKGPECWEWTGAHHEFGYGRFNLGGGRIAGSHRLSYEMAYGPIPDGFQVCHICDNPRCVNPAHLVVGTAKFNAVDAQRKGRLRNGVSIGSANGCAKLTEVQVAEILERYAAGGIGQERLARQYGVTRNVVYEIVHGHKWRHVSHGAMKPIASTPALKPSDDTMMSR